MFSSIGLGGIGRGICIDDLEMFVGSPPSHGFELEDAVKV